MNYTEGLWRINDNHVEYGLELYNGNLHGFCGAKIEGSIIIHKGYVVFNGDFGEMTCDEVCTILLRYDNMIYDHITEDNYFYPHPEED